MMHDPDDPMIRAARALVMATGVENRSRVQLEQASRGLRRASEERAVAEQVARDLAATAVEPRRIIVRTGAGASGYHLVTLCRVERDGETSGAVMIEDVEGPA